MNITADSLLTSQYVSELPGTIGALSASFLALQPTDTSIPYGI